MCKGVRRFLLLVCSLVLILACSCSEVSVSDRKINIVSIGIDYTETVWNSLPKNIDDAVQVGYAFDSISKEDCSIYYLIGSKQEKIDRYEHIWPQSKKRVLHPSFENFSSVVNAVALDASENDMTIIYVSSHGATTDEIEKNGYKYDYFDSDNMQNDANILFLTDERIPVSVREGNSTVTKYLYDLNYVSMAAFFDTIEKIPGVKFVIADCCYAGALVATDNITVDKNEFGNTNFLDVFFSTAKAKASSSVFCIASSEYFYPSYSGNDEHHSFFTRVLLNGLGWIDDNLSDPKTSEVVAAKGKTLTFNDLASWLYKNGAKANIKTGSQCVTCSSSSLDVDLLTLK